MSNKFILLAALGATAAAAAPATAQRWDFRPGAAGFRLEGMGVPDLYPALRASPRGRAFVIRNFDLNEDGRINRREAAAANRAYFELAGARRDRFDWASVDAVPIARPHWDARAMRDYGFRQTPRGAMMSLSEEVLFATDSAVLRPGAIDRLRPLAAYLADSRGVRIAIDGHTDSRGTDAHNLDLSERRAEAVRNALEDMGVTRARFTVVGHGERNPVATNATAAGMRQNRRVEVTLLGQRADRFALRD